MKNSLPSNVGEKLAGMPVLVTGGAGFIGSHVANSLAECGADVRVIDDLSSGHRSNLADDIEFHEASVLDRDALIAAMVGCHCVFHMAALVSVSESVIDPRRCMRVNVGGTQCMLDVARESGVERVVCATSAAAYGESPNLPSREDDPVQCCSPYAASKVACECLLQSYAHCYGLSTISLRLFNIFGPRQDPKSPYAAVISAFADAILNGRQPKVFGDGMQTRDFTYVENVVYACALAATTETNPRGDVVNIGCGRSPSLLAVLEAMSGAINVTTTPIFDAPRSGDVLHSQADVSRAMELIGYSPLVDFEEAIHRTMQAERERSLQSLERISSI